MSETKFGIRAWVVQVLYFCVFATLLALVEIMIEGPQGWSAGLKYNWVPKQHGWYMMPWQLLMGGDKIFDGYHLFMNLFLLAVFHMPYVAPAAGRVKWTGRGEIQTLVMFLYMGALWDFLWFVWNPYYGVHRFDAAHVPWHHSWWGPVPAGYPVAVIVTTVIVTAYGLYARFVRKEPDVLKQELTRHVATVAALIAFALVSILAAGLIVTPR